MYSLVYGKWDLYSGKHGKFRSIEEAPGKEETGKDE
jgi:hypothetical protein